MSLYTGESAYQLTKYQGAEDMSILNLGDTIKGYNYAIMSVKWAMLNSSAGEEFSPRSPVGQGAGNVLGLCVSS